MPGRASAAVLDAPPAAQQAHADAQQPGQQPDDVPQQQQQQQQPAAPATQPGRQPAAAPPAPPLAQGSRYCCFFMHRLLDFREAELLTLAEMFGGQRPELEPLDADAAAVPGGAWPLRYLTLPDDATAAAIAARSILIKAILDVWVEADSLPALLDALRALPPERTQPHVGADATFRINLSAMGRKWGEQAFQSTVLSLVQAAGFKGRVNLRQPDACFWAVAIDVDAEVSGVPPMPRRFVFGRAVGVGDRGELLTRYALPSRVFIGPTSMDPELAFIMTNMAHVRPGHLVLDPYLGTGSILVAAAARGAATMGTEIDARVVMRGKADPSAPGGRYTVWSNFQQYNLPPPLGVLRADVHRHPFRSGLTEVFDALLGDPPYGVRAGGRKSRALPDACVRDPDTHFPSTAPYPLTECLDDLVELAAQLLVTGGRLAFWMPSAPVLYREDELPAHPCLQLVANSEQLLSGRYSRRLITMVKTKPWDAAESAAWRAGRAGFVMALERLADTVYQSKEEYAAAHPAGEDGAPPGSKPRYRGKNL